MLQVKLIDIFYVYFEIYVALWTESVFQSSSIEKHYKWKRWIESKMAGMMLSLFPSILSMPLYIFFVNAYPNVLYIAEILKSLSKDQNIINKEQNKKNIMEMFTENIPK